VLSPVYADVSGFPPTLFITSGRDLLLSGTTILHRVYLRAGVDGQLVVFEALPQQSLSLLSDMSDDDPAIVIDLGTLVGDLLHLFAYVAGDVSFGASPGKA
jgi:acetyl esterase/lipase